MSIPVSRVPALRAFVTSCVITTIDRQLTSGKEATVYRCTAHPRLGRPFIAAKVYHPLERRMFRNDAIYQHGRIAWEGRMQRALVAKSTYGQRVQFGLWHTAEYQALRRLHRAGVQVPEPLAHGDGVILMDYIGDEQEPAPRLKEVRLTDDEAPAAWSQVHTSIERMLACHLVHADLSPFNILWWKGQVQVIDLPQAVDPRVNPAAYDLLVRDLTSLSRYFLGHGIDIDAQGLGWGLWQRYRRGVL